MSEILKNLEKLINSELSSKVLRSSIINSELSIEISEDDLVEIVQFLKSNEKIEPAKPDLIANEENIIKSPMVGVAYLSADPNSAPYIKIGQHVKAGDTLLLIEAMKTFNEIKAPRSGVIKKIVVLNYSKNLQIIFFPIDQIGN